jgi:pimeloyl-ACP methyl ester carboxylesterase
VCWSGEDAAVDIVDLRRELTGGPDALSTERLLDLARRSRGELLEGLALPEQDAFEAWLLTERDAARRTRAALLGTLVGRLAGAAPEAAVEHARELLEADPYSLESHAALLRCLRRAGRREEADGQRELSRRRLAALGIGDLSALDDTAPPPDSAVVSAAFPPATTPLRQEIRFCTSRDGVRIGYAVVGEGPPLIKTANWLNHLEYDWESPLWRHVFRGLARRHRLIRYDARGNGLSDWDVPELSFPAFVEDLETVVEASGVEAFPLLGISQGCAISIEYAVRHPERVTRLVLHGGYATGWKVGEDAAEIARREALKTLILHGWGRDNPAFRQVFTSAFIPGGTPEQFHWMNELMRMTISPENAVRLQDALAAVDIRDRLPMVQVPTLVLHSRGDGRIPYAKGVELARGIPHARFVTLESENHLLLHHEPEFPRFLDEVLRFLAEDGSG